MAYLVLGLLVLCCTICTGTYAFTCSTGAESCQDQGVQLHSSGGKIAVTLVNGTNLPDRDKFQASRLSDPYVELSVGGTTVRSKTVQNAEHPYWNEVLDLGYHRSGDSITIKVYDADSGLEFSDDLLFETVSFVPFCSMFHARIVEADCNGEFGRDCDLLGTPWLMPSQPRCQEAGWINLDGNETSECLLSEDGVSTAACLFLSFDIIPFQVSVTDNYNADKDVQLTVAGYSSTLPVEDEYVDYGKIYVERSQLLDDRETLFEPIAGGILIRTDSDQAGVTGDKEYVDLAFNMNCDLYMCRWKHDEANLGTPAWLLEEGWSLSSRRIILDGLTLVDEFMMCYTKTFSYTEMNYFGGLESSTVTLRSNGVTGDEEYMYVAVAVPHMDDVIEETFWTKSLNASILWLRFAENIIVFVAFLSMGVHRLHSMSWNIHRLESHVIECAQMSSGTTSNTLLSILTLCKGKSENDKDLRRNLYFAALSLRLCLFMPLLIIWSWGISTCISVHPPGIGAFITFAGTSFLLLYLGFHCWISSGWLISWTSLACFAISITSIMVFCIVVIFTDPPYRDGDESISFTSLTTTFLTLNLLPLVTLIFISDSDLRASYSRLKLAASNNSARNDVDTFDEMAHQQKDNDVYTLCQPFRVFSLTRSISSTYESTSIQNCMLYAASVFFLFCYQMVSICTVYPALAFLNIVTVLVLDSVNLSLHRGSSRWSPLLSVLIMSSSRCFIMAFSGTYWLIGYSFAFVVYGGALVRSSVRRHFPCLNARQASTITFLGYDPSSVCNDLAAKPEVTLFYTSLYIIFLFILLSYSHPSNLPLTPISIGDQEWGQDIFCMLSILFVLGTGLYEATILAYELDSKSLLKPGLSSAYIWHPAIRLPILLAILTFVFISLSGLLLWGASGNVVAFLVLFFVPIITSLGIYSFKQWCLNDFEVVWWPPNSRQDLKRGIVMKDELGADSTGRRNGEEHLQYQMRCTYVRRPDDDIQSNHLRVGLFISHLIDKIALLGKMFSLRRMYSRNGFTRVSPHVERRQQHRNTVDTDASTSTGMITLRESMRESTRKNGVEEFGIEESPQTEMGSSNDNVNSSENDKGGLVSSSATTKANGILTSSDHENCSSEYRQKVCSLSFYRAFLEGYLLPFEYAQLASITAFLCLILFFGLLISSVLTSSWVGHVVWCSSYVLVFTSTAGIKYLNTYEMDTTIRISTGLATMLHILQCVLLFFIVLEGNANEGKALVILNVLIGFPVLSFGFIKLLVAQDTRNTAKRRNTRRRRRRSNSSRATTAKDDEEDLVVVENEKEELKERMRKLIAKVHSKLQYMFTYEVTLIICVAAWLWQSFVWGNIYLGAILVSTVIIIELLYLQIRGLTSRESTSTLTQKNLQPAMYMLMAVSLVVGLTGIGLEAYCVSVFFLIWVMQITMQVIMRYIEIKDETEVVCNCLMLPAFSYNVQTGSLVDETSTLVSLLCIPVVGVMWGICLAALVHPLAVGVFITCTMVMMTVILCAVFANLTLLHFSKTLYFLKGDMVVESEVVARAAYYDRKRVYYATCPEWDEIAVSSGDSRPPQQLHPSESAASLAKEVEMADKGIRMTINSFTKEEQLRPDFMFHTTDALSEAFFAGKGPLGIIGLWGLWYKLTQVLSCRCTDNWVLRNFNSNGLRRIEGEEDWVWTEGSSPLMDDLIKLKDVESKCFEAANMELTYIMHFQVLLLLSTESGIQKESVTFRQFLTEYKSTLSANGVAPPSKLFSSESFGSVDGRMAAIWLTSLTQEACWRFQNLRSEFTTISDEQEKQINEEDEATANLTTELEAYRKPREVAMKQNQAYYTNERRKGRVDAWRNTLDSNEKERFSSLEDLWMNHKHVSVDSDDLNLRKEFEEHVLLNGDEEIINARQWLEQIESEFLCCFPGQQGGRHMQYCDNEFPPNGESLGEPTCIPEIQNIEWKSSISANPDICLYNQIQGPSLNDVQQGRISNGWLLSAICMLSVALNDNARNSASEGEYETQHIPSLFISHMGSDQELITESDVGVYAVQLILDGEPLILYIDDQFPVLEPSLCNSSNRGIAMAYTPEMRYSWVSLLEKSFAKLYGNYEQLEVGHTWQALRNLTGCDAEEIFLSSACHGVGQAALWKTLLRYKQNGYIVGAATTSSHYTGNHIQNSGLQFDQMYVVLDVREMDGHKLIKLRNPPGHHEEWKGDWSDESPVWNRRLRYLLGHVEDSNDNSFWMEYCDFCVAYRSLHVCRWHDPSSWYTSTLYGSWELTEEQNTAPGLPSLHQPFCHLEENPQYVLIIQELSEVSIKFSQFDSEIHPAACYILQTGHQGAKTTSEDGEDQTITNSNTYDYWTRNKRAKYLSHDIIMSSTGQPAYKRVQYLHCTLSAGFYIILAATYMAGMEGNFCIDIISNNEGVTVKQLWPPKKNTKGKTLTSRRVSFFQNP